MARTSIISMRSWMKRTRVPPPMTRSCESAAFSSVLPLSRLALTLSRAESFSSSSSRVGISSSSVAYAVARAAVVRADWTTWRTSLKSLVTSLCSRAVRVPKTSKFLFSTA